MVFSAEKEREWKRHKKFPKNTDANSKLVENTFAKNEKTAYTGASFPLLSSCTSSSVTAVNHGQQHREKNPVHFKFVQEVRRRYDHASLIVLRSRTSTWENKYHGPPARW